VAKADCLIADGLDECGDLVVLVANALQRWANAHPSIRVVLTSRPIGYETSYFSSWEQYDLMPLTQDQVQSSSWEFIQALVFGATAEKQFTHFQEQLQKSSTASLAARNPLLLGFLIQVSLEGETVVHSRAQLYEQILNTWRVSLPQGRQWRVSHLDMLLAWRSLEIIGWSFLLSDHEQIICADEQLLRHLTLQLVQEMGVQPLQASSVANNCLQFWHERGVLDRSYQGSQEMSLFLHRTINEYAAGRYLAHLSRTEIQGWVRKNYSNVRWREPILLAAGCGAVEIIVETLLEIDHENEQTTFPLLLAAEALAEASIPPGTLVQLVVHRITACLASPHPTAAYEVAEQGVSLVKKVPELFASVLPTLFQHSQQWTRVSALYLALEANDIPVPPHELDAFLDMLLAEELLPERTQSYFSGTGKKLFTVGWDFQNKMLVRVAEVLAHIRPDAQTKSVIQTIYEKHSTISSGTHQELRNVLVDLRCDTFLKEYDRKEAEKWKGGLLGSHVKKHQADAEQKVLEIILRQTAFPNVSIKKRRKLQFLATLLYTLQVPETPFRDWLALRRLDDVAAIEAVLSGYIEALHLNKEELALDTVWVAAELKKMKLGEDIQRSLLSLLPKFPISSALQKMTSLPVAKKDLLRALHHPSVIIAMGAANLLEAAQEGKEEVAVLLLQSRDQRLLSILVQIAEALLGEEARHILMKRLAQENTPEDWFLIEKLPSLPGNDADIQFQQTLRRELEKREPDRVIAAVHALQTIEISLIRDISPMLPSILLFWREQGTKAKATLVQKDKECPACKAVPGDVCMHVSKLIEQLS
jgi:hypothetical protein